GHGVLVAVLLSLDVQAQCLDRRIAGNGDWAIDRVPRAEKFVIGNVGDGRLGVWFSGKRYGDGNAVCGFVGQCGLRRMENGHPGGGLVDSDRGCFLSQSGERSWWCNTSVDYRCARLRTKCGAVGSIVARYRTGVHLATGDLLCAGGNSGVVLSKI